MYTIFTIAKKHLVVLLYYFTMHGLWVGVHFWTPKWCTRQHLPFRQEIMSLNHKDATASCAQESK